MIRILLVFTLFTFINVEAQIGESNLKAGIDYMNNKQTDLALGEFTKYIALCNQTNQKDNVGKGYWLRAKAYVVAGNYGSALEDFKNSKTLYPQEDYYANIAECFYYLKDYKNVIAVMNDGLPQSILPETKGRLLKYSGLSLYENGEKEIGCETLKAAVNYGNIEAIQYFMEYCQSDPESKFYSAEIYESLKKESLENNTSVKKMADGSEYIGATINGKREGNGSIKWLDGSYLEGTFKNDKLNGKGKWTFASGEYYEGDFVDNKKEGIGTYKYKNGSVYVGEWKADKIYGKGTYAFTSGSIYSGNFVDNIPQGTMNVKDPDGSTFIGQMSGWEKNGSGSASYANGDSYNGTFMKDMMEGSGVYTFKGGIVYKGTFKAGQFDGVGKMTFPDGNTWYEGDFVNGKFEGKGIFHYADGSYYKGDFKAGKKDGTGTLYDAKGAVAKEGKWISDTYIK